MKKNYAFLLLLSSMVTFAQNYNFTVFTQSNSNMQNTNINHISIDGNGLLWLSTFAGLSTFNGTTFTHYTPQNSTIPTNSITKTVIDNLNRKWSSTYNDGIILFDGTTFTSYKTTNSQIPSNAIRDIAVDGNNNVWIATNSGLTKFDGTTWTNYNEGNSDLPGNNVSSIGIDGSNNVYFISSGTVLRKMTGTTISIIADGVMEILKVKDNELYCHTLYGFTKYINGDQVASYDYLAGGSCLLDCQPSALDIDENNKVWIANYVECAQGGIQNFTDCTNYITTGTNAINYVTAFKVQSSNVIWGYVAELGLVKMTKNNLGTDNFTSEKTAAVYPNPVQNILNVSFDQKIDNITVYNILGQQVMAKSINADNGNLDVSNLDAGTYFVKVAAGSSVQTLKVIKQ